MPSMRGLAYAALAPADMDTKSTHRAALFALALITTIAVIAGYHGYAHAAYRASFDNAPLAQRLESASRAAGLEPWIRIFEVRRIRLEAERFFLAEDYDAAHGLMQPIIAAREGDAEFIEYYHVVNAEWVPASARKAHQQHGHEGPGGTLRPEDVER